MRKLAKRLALSLYGRLKSITHSGRLEAERDLEIALQREATRSSSSFITENCLNAHTFNDRFSLLKYAMELSRGTAGDILEFGVHRGVSLRFLGSEAACTPQSNVFGFDCLSGLPEDWPGCGKAGDFKLEMRPDTGQNATFIEGLFQDTLPDFTKRYGAGCAIRLIHIDSDLYSSCKYVLETLKPWIKDGTVIVFDEYFNYPGWQNGEHRAWREFIECHRINFEYIAYNKKGWQVGIRVTEGQALQ